jgi:acetolactate synthase I/II/III large subunit
MKAAELFVKCLENEGVKYIFGVPGEENIDVMDALLDSNIEFITTRHEQGAAFMADVYGRVTGNVGVCLSTLGPGATNLITGIADANMDFAPVVAIAGQGSTTRMHKESHQILDLGALFKPITKYTVQIREAEIIPEAVRKAFKLALTEKTGASFIELPENIAGSTVEKVPLLVQHANVPAPLPLKVQQAIAAINEARFPIILAGNGVVRTGASDELKAFASKLGIPVANTFMAKGVTALSDDVSLGTVGLKSADFVSFAFERADVVICVGYDMVEYQPEYWNPRSDKLIIHIAPWAAEVDEHYIVGVGVIGEIGVALSAIAAGARPRSDGAYQPVRTTIIQEQREHDSDSAFPIKPQKIVSDLRKALRPDDIVICDVGAHKMWMARMYDAQQPNTCIISNGFAAMGIAVPGAFATKLANPRRRVIAVTGDAGFLMNSQEIETALRYKAAFVILVWNDSEYGLITWHQMRHFGRPSHIAFKNPDLVKYAESFGAKGYRVSSSEDLLPTLELALVDDTVAIVDCQVDYTENMRLTHRLPNLKSPF